jgi:predicted Zn-dependent protease with MMP-like domain
VSGLVHIELLLDKAEAALDAGEAETALELCNEVLSRSPVHPGAQFVKGDALRVLGDLPQAADAYRAAALTRPEHASSWASLALTSFELLDFEEARRSVGRSVREDPRNPEAWWVRSLIQEWRGDFAGAQRSLAHAQWLDPVGFPMPPSLADDEVERLVEKAILKLHPSLQELLANVPIILDEIPSLDTLLQYHPPASPLEILGYFSGNSIMEKSMDDPWSQIPATIVLFRRNLYRISNSRAELIEQIRVTLFHEIGHFLGLDEADLEARHLD